MSSNTDTNQHCDNFPVWNTANPTPSRLMSARVVVNAVTRTVIMLQAVAFVIMLEFMLGFLILLSNCGL